MIKSHHISYPVKKFKVEFFLEYCFVEWFAIEELVVMGNFDILLIGRGCFVAMIVALPFDLCFSCCFGYYQIGKQDVDLALPLASSQDPHHGMTPYG